MHNTYQCYCMTSRSESPYSYIPSATYRTYCTHLPLYSLHHLLLMAMSKFEKVFAKIKQHSLSRPPSPTGDSNPTLLPLLSNGHASQSSTDKYPSQSEVDNTNAEDLTAAQKQQSSSEHRQVYCRHERGR